MYSKNKASVSETFEIDKYKSKSGAVVLHEFALFKYSSGG